MPQPLPAATRRRPTGAERTRSAVQAAASVTVVTAAYRAHLEGRHAVEPDGTLLLDLPPGSKVAAAAAGGASAVVEVTDVAPVAVRDRVRARVSLAGWLEPGMPGGPAWRLAPLVVTLDEAGQLVDLDGDEYAAASPDPLCEVEADLLAHLDAAHAADLDALLHACGPGLDAGRRTRPLRLDRLGLTLRVERPTGYCDVRVPFRHSVGGPHEAGEQLRALTLAALTARHARRAR